MNKQTVLNNLCIYDKRNPDYDPEMTTLSDDQFREPRTDCFCDNCFYGRDALAVEILRLTK